MAKHNINHSKTTKLIAGASKLGGFQHPPLVIPRDKLEVAHLKVKRAQARNKYLIAIILILIAVQVLMLKGVIHL